VAKRIERAVPIVKRDVELWLFCPEDDEMFNSVGCISPKDLFSLVSMMARGIDHDFPTTFAEFIKNYKHTSVHSVRELVGFNEANKKRALPQGE
jgi:hypothetical protein